MKNLEARFQFASAPDSWGVLDYEGPSWQQSYEKMLQEMSAAGYTGTELGPYGFFPTDAGLLRSKLEEHKLSLLASFVPVVLSDPASAKVVSKLLVLDGVEAVRADTLVVEVNDPGKPALVRGDGEDEYRYLLMPVKVS